MTTTALPSGLAGLARIEARRFARHPLFLVGVGLLVVTLVMEVMADPVNPGQMANPIYPAMLLGVFGLVVAARLTRTSSRSLETLGAPPVPERTRTLALALACLVPAAVAAVWTAFSLIWFAAHPPVPEAWWFDTLPASHIVAYHLGAAVVAAYGGPVLGVVIGRWIRWSGAPIVAAVLLVAVTIMGSGIVEAIRPVRQLFPWTMWYGGDDGAGADWYYRGNPAWWLLYVVALSVVGVIAALLHDRDLPRRGLLLAGAAVLAVGLAFSVLSMTTGPREDRLSPAVLHPEQLQR